MKSMAKKQLLVTVLIMSMVMFFAAPLTAFAGTGSVWTTDSLNSIQDQSKYDSKQDVYFRVSGFPAGSDLYVQVTEPGGNTVLGSNPNSIYHITDDTQEISFKLWNVVYDSHGNPGYDTTSNGGGNYTLSVSTNQDMSNSKHDDFKVDEPSISLVKSVYPLTVDSKNADVTYTLTVTNDGDTALTDVVLTDDLLGLSINIGSLAKGAAVTTNAAFNLGNLSAEDWDENTFTNTATVEGDHGDATVSDSDDATVTFSTTPQEPTISLEKSVNPTTVASKDGSVTYTFTVTNGAVSLTGVDLTDELIGVDITIGDMVPGQVFTTDAAFDLGNLSAEAWVENEFKNTATVEGNHGDATVSDSDDATVTYDEPSTEPDEPGLSIEKDVRLAGADADYGDSITVEDADGTVPVEYQFTVTNTGNVTVSAVDVFDQTLVWASDENIELSPGESYQFTTTATINADDWDENNEFVNTAFAKGYYGEEIPVTSETDSATVEYYYNNPNTSEASILLDKTVSDSTVSSRNSDVTYTFTVTNNGDYDLYGVTVHDDDINADIFIGDLAMGETKTVTADFDLGNLGDEGYGDWDGNTFTNTATVTGYDPRERSVSDTDDATVRYRSNPGPGPGPGPGPNPPVIIPNEPTPAAPVILPEEQVPAGPLPQTGGVPAILLYGLGALLAGGGAALKLKKK